MCEQTSDLLTLVLLQFLSPVAGGLCYSYLLQAVSKRRFAFDSGIKTCTGSLCYAPYLPED